MSTLGFLDRSLFNAFWALFKKMWLLGIGVLLAEFMLGFAIGAAGGGEGGEAIINISSLIINIIFGVNGNSWREKNLISRGFEYLDTVNAANSDGAVAVGLRAAVS